MGGEVAFFVDFFGILVGCLVFFLPFWLRVRAQDGALVPAVAGREKKIIIKRICSGFCPAPLVCRDPAPSPRGGDESSPRAGARRPRRGGPGPAEGFAPAEPRQLLYRRHLWLSGSEGWRAPCLLRALWKGAANSLLAMRGFYKGALPFLKSGLVVISHQRALEFNFC